MCRRSWSWSSSRPWGSLPGSRKPSQGWSASAQTRWSSAPPPSAGELRSGAKPTDKESNELLCKTHIQVESVARASLGVGWWGGEIWHGPWTNWRLNNGALAEVIVARKAVWRSRGAHRCVTNNNFTWKRWRVSMCKGISRHRLSRSTFYAQPRIKKSRQELIAGGVNNLNMAQMWRIYF